MEGTQFTIPANVPLMAKERFSELTGVPEGVVQGWIEKGHIATIKIGRHRLINIAVLTQECMEAEQ